MFTTAPAIAILGEFSRNNSIFVVVLLGAFGSMLGDYIIFLFMRDRVSQDLHFLLGHSRSRRLQAIFKTRLFHFLTPFAGALVIASPLPDELGLAILGLSKMDEKVFFPVSFVFNALGILIISWVANTAIW